MELNYIIDLVDIFMVYCQDVEEQNLVRKLQLIRGFDFTSLELEGVHSETKIP